MGGITEVKRREIRRLKPENMADYIDIYLNAYPAGKDLSAECRQKYYDRNLQSLMEYDHVNFFGMFEKGGSQKEPEETLIAIMKLIDFDMNLFGEMKRACGLMSLGVHPLHKKKGAARDMVRFFEQYTVDSGAAVAMLLPFRMDFYRKLGYGCGSRLDEYHIKTEYLPELRIAGVDGQSRAGKAGKPDCVLRLLDRDAVDRSDAVDQMVACHRRFVERNHGAVCKFEEEIRDMRADDEIRRLGCFRQDRLAGYAAFTFINTSDCNYTLNLMDVKELVYDDEEVLRILLGGLRMQGDLAQSVILRSGEPDFYHLLQSCQDMSGNYIDYGFLQTNVSAVGTMYKIPDVQGFIAAASHRLFLPEEMTVGFCVEDELAAAERRFALVFAKSACQDCSFWSYDGSEQAYENADVRVSCKLSDLSSLLMGSAELGGLIRLGVMQVSDPAWTGRLDRLFHAEQKPFTNTDY